MYGSRPMCLLCKHYRPKTPKYTCDAYPEGIPDAIMQGKVDHRNHFHDDNGIVFQAKNAEYQQMFDELVAPQFEK